VKCSLLTLSTYIDGELVPDRRAEVDAHLVGCPRCSAGAATLREERVRVGQLARVRVAPQSMRLMLEQVGIRGAADLPLPARPPEPAPTPSDQMPWQSATSSPALPWTPRRPVPTPAPFEETPLATVAADADAQPDLPFDGPRAREQSWSAPAAAALDAPASLEVGAAQPRPSPAPPAPEPGWTSDEAEAAYEPPAAAIDHHEPAAITEPAPQAIAEPVSEIDTGDGDWEMDLPPSIESDVEGDAWARQATEPVPIGASQHGESLEAEAAPVPIPAVDARPPTRVAASGPAMVWSRVRDAVAVRMALARSSEAAEDSMQIVNGGPPRRAPNTAAEPEGGSVELTGVPGMARPAHAVYQPAEALVASPPATESSPPIWSEDDLVTAPARASEPADWNAFGASAYRREEREAVDDGFDQAPPARPRAPGRHSRAVARDDNDLLSRMRSTLTGTMAAARDRIAGGAGGGRHAGKAARTGSADRRIVAAIAAVVVIFVAALLIGHQSSTSTQLPGATSTRLPVTPTSAPSHAGQPATAAPSAAAPTAAPVAAAAPQSFGAGGTGFQVSDLRYGQQPGYFRIVFDMGPVTGNTGTSPTTTVTFSNPTTMLVTFNGTVPAGSVGSPPAGKIVSSVTLVSSSGGKTVYRFVLTHAATATAGFLTGTTPPLRFVLDLH
jgi:hypothetical protein